jgi:hypothetical protein
MVLKVAGTGLLRKEFEFGRRAERPPIKTVLLELPARPGERSRLAKRSGFPRLKRGATIGNVAQIIKG